ncbi:MAG: metallophosphoesterase [Actinomycetota bacterium]|nr:metallophosphoesterase [Actinomycetota bacterium]
MIAKIARVAKYAVLGALGVVLLLLSWGLIEPYFIDTEEQVAEIPGLPSSWEGQRIGVIADWQIGMWLDNTRTMRRSAELLAEERPAAVLIAGDFVYGPSDDNDEDIRKVGEFVRPLTEAGIPTYAVLGNHDYRMAYKDSEPNPRAAERVREALESAGVRVLKNEAVSLKAPETSTGHERAAGGVDPLRLVGIGARWPDEDRPEAALSGVPDEAPRFVMMHNPNSFGAFPAGTAPVAVAGHTHGGQVRIPFLPEWSWLKIVEDDEIHVDGWIEGFGEPGNQLYVNRGIGFSVVPIRINCRPEVTLFTLRPAQ